MNCTTCQYELSMCLDGRLPSGRRSVVMQHVDGCEGCSEFWNELQAAQKLALLLPREKVSDGFREQLWERIRSGEGTPEAVFHEPVPMLAKARYVLTGAAAAAAVLVCARFLRDDPKVPHETQVAAVDGGSNGNTSVAPHGGGRGAIGVADGRSNAMPSREVVRFEDTPLVSAAQRLTTDVFALEAARQLEQRHALAQLALRRVGGDATDKDAAVDQALTNAQEFRTFGECLLDLRDRNHLWFAEPLVEADLRRAVQMLGGSSLEKRGVATVREIVSPALQSNRLSRIASTISLPLMTPREERDVLIRMNTQRPEVFPMLFFVFGSDAEFHDPAFLQRGQAFVLDDPCGPGWVAPRSEVAQREVIVRIRTGK